MELQVTNGSPIEVSDAIFARDFNEGLIHQAVVTHMAGMRSGTKAQKNRSAVSGGGIKPWRQKGTGRARAGTSRSPLWRAGGVTFAATNRDFTKKINKKMQKAALKSILSGLVREEALIVVDSLSFEAPKTKSMLSFLADNAKTNDALIILADGNAEMNMNAYLSSRNIPHCEVLEVLEINAVSLIAHEKVIVEKAAIEKIQEWLA